MLPTAARTWSISPSNRIPYTSVEDVLQRELLGMKDHWRSATGVTVVGSSDGLVMAFDGEDRWATSTDIRGSAWIVLRAAGLGDAEIILERHGATDVLVAFAPSGYQLVSGRPWAGNEQILSSGRFDVEDIYGDRLWSSGFSSAGDAFWFFLARARSIHRLVLLQLCDSAVAAPATFDPAVVGFSLDNRCLEVRNFVARAKGVAYVNDVPCALFVGGESYGGAVLSVEVQTTQSELQGGYLVQPLSTWSETPGARGKVGNLVDIWAGVAALSDGDLLPDDGTKQMIAIGQLVISWDGVTDPVLV